MDKQFTLTSIFGWSKNFFMVILWFIINFFHGQEE